MNLEFRLEFGQCASVQFETLVQPALGVVLYRAGVVLHDEALARPGQSREDQTCHARHMHQIGCTCSRVCVMYAEWDAMGAVFFAGRGDR